MFKNKFKKDKFKGKAHTLDDPAPPKPDLAPKKPAAQAAAPPPAPTNEPPPGPGNRSTKISFKSANEAAAPPPKVDQKEYQFTGADAKGMNIGASVQPKTFADANRGATRAQPLTANIKFNIQSKGPTCFAEARFATSEKLSALYTFLETEVFTQVCQYEIIQPYPRSVIPRDDEKTLASQKISGHVMFQVVVKGDAKFRQ